MKYTLTLIFFLVPFTTKSQNLFPEQFNNCLINSFNVENKQIRAKATCKELFDAIIPNIDSTILKDLEGDIFIQVLVNSKGHPCTLSLKSNLNVPYKILKINKIINKETKWNLVITQEAMEASPEIAMVSVTLRIEFRKESILLQRLGGHFNSDTDWAELEHYAVKR